MGLEKINTPASTDLERIDRWDKFRKSEAFPWVASLLAQRVQSALERLQRCAKEDVIEVRGAYNEAVATLEAFEQEGRSCLELEKKILSGK